MKNSIKTGLIGVIVPVYKTEQYVAECIESILAQTYINFRLILVDDGSPDGADAICDEYAKKDKRITIIHQENAGVTRARARGVEEASDCEWITFVDSDDTITHNALEILADAVSDGTDIIIYDYFQKFTNCASISINEYRYFLVSEINISGAPWGKLFRRKIFNNIVFSTPRDITTGEDVIMNIHLAFNTKNNVFILKNHIYNYRFSCNSVSHTHKQTVEYAQYYCEYKQKAIPNKHIGTLMPAIVNAKLLKFKEIWGYKYAVSNMKNNIFYNELKMDIKKCDYKLSATDYIIFNCTNPVIRFITINIKKTTTILQTILQKLIINK